jgi:hypothetical protein
MESKQSNTPATRTRTGRWSVIDTAILLLILVAIAGIIYRIVITVTDDGDVGTRCQVYFEVSETHRDVLDGIQGFDEVYLLENDMLLGSIGATSIDPETGKGVAALTPKNAEGSDMATATGCMVCRGTVTKGGSLLVGETGQYLSRGSVLTVRTDRAVLTIRITDIK